jgi:hypothetical protein
MKHVVSTVNRPMSGFDHAVPMTYPSRDARTTHFAPHFRWLLALEDASRFTCQFQGRGREEVAMFTFEDENIAFRFKLRFG